MQQHTIKIEKTARYFSFGEPGPGITSLWFVLHGYGQLAEFFIRKFKPLDDGKTMLVAPEGLHRFYVKGYSGRVGASWMTKEARLDDIHDYITFLDQLYESVITSLGGQQVKIHVVGFSQGAATACRWVAHRKSIVDHLILWSGVFPPDLDFEKAIPTFTSKNCLLLAGDEDPFIPQEEMEGHLAALRERNIPHRFIPFKGGHDIKEQELVALRKILEP